jgi:hypothetical protein
VQWAGAKLNSSAGRRSSFSATQDLIGSAWMALPVLLLCGGVAVVYKLVAQGLEYQ